jgi:hypothetical protein
MKIRVPNLFRFLIVHVYKFYVRPLAIQEMKIVFRISQLVKKLKLILSILKPL